MRMLPSSNPMIARLEICGWNVMVVARILMANDKRGLMLITEDVDKEERMGIYL